MRVIYGANAKEAGRIFVNGKEEKIRSCQDAIRCGIGYIPEDRKNHGVFLRMSIKWNTVANNLKGYSNGLFVDQKGKPGPRRNIRRNLKSRLESGSAGWQLIGRQSAEGSYRENAGGKQPDYHFRRADEGNRCGSQA